MTIHERFLPTSGTPTRAVADMIEQNEGVTGFSEETFEGFALLQSGLPTIALREALADIENNFPAIAERLTDLLRAEGILRATLHQLLINSHPATVNRFKELDTFVIAEGQRDAFGKPAVGLVPRRTGTMVYIDRDSLDMGEVDQVSRFSVAPPLGLGRRTLLIDRVKIIDPIEGNKGFSVTSHDFGGDGTKVVDVACTDS